MISTSSLVGGRKLRARYQASSWACLFASVAFVGAYYYLGDHGRDWIWVALINLPILVYVVFGLSYGGREYRILARYAESAYFLGYATTVGCLLIVANRIAGGGDFAGSLGLIFVRGAQAVLSTVVGLAGMFVLRVRAQGFEDEEATVDTKRSVNPVDALAKQSDEILATINEKSRRMAEALDALLARFETRQADSIQNVSDAAGALARNLEAIDQRVTRLTVSMEALEPKLEETGTALGGISAHSTIAASSAAMMARAAGDFATAAERINTQIGAMEPMAAAVTVAVGAVEKLRSQLNSCSVETGRFAAGAVRAQQEMSAQIDALRERAARVGSLTDDVRSFNATANEVAVPVKAIVGNLEKLAALSDRLNSLGQALVTVDDAFRGVQGSVMKIQEGSLMMSNQTEQLVEQLKNRVHDLTNLAGPLNEFGREMTRIRPHLNALNGDQDVIAKVGVALDKLLPTLTVLEGAGRASVERVKELNAVAVDLMKTERDLQRFE